MDLFTTASALPPQWDTLLPDEHFLRAATLTAHEAAALPDVTYLYYLIYAGDEPVAAAVFQVLSLRRHHFNISSLRRTQRMLAQLALAAAQPRLLVAGHLFRHDVETFYHRPGLTHYQEYNAYKACIDAALRAGRAGAVLVKDMPEALIPYFANHAPQYIQLRNDISMEMDIPAHWENIAGYEKDLKHKYAQRFRKVRAAAADLQIRLLEANEIASMAPQLHALYSQVTAHQTVRLGLLTETFIPKLKAHYNNGLQVWGFFESNTLVAFASAWSKPEALDMFFIGFDYSRNAELQLYFNILFFAVEEAVRQRKPRLILGRTALEAKARVGCVPRYLNTYLCIRNVLLRALVSRIQARVNGSEGSDWEQRHPFKS